MRITRTSFAAISFFVFAVTITSCSSGGPKPEGKDFLSESTKYGSSGSGRGSAFVSPDARKKTYKKVGVMPFRAPIELAGASISDMFTTELLKTYKYKLIERSQIEQVLEEQALGLKGVTDSALALKVGKMLGVDGVIVGTVPEYGLRAVGEYELPAVGINVRLIDGETGSIVWSITDSAIAGKPISLSVFANRMVESMIYRLTREWVLAGDTMAIHLPTPEVISHRGEIRKAVIEVMGVSPNTFKSYRLSRSRTKRGPYKEISTKENRRFGQVELFEDEGLLDAETYYYKVEGVSSLGLTSLPVGPLQITTTGPPARVEGLKAEGNLARMVKIRWDPLNDPAVKAYNIFRSENKDGGYKKIKVITNKNEIHYLDKGKSGGFFNSGASLGDHVTYYYKIQAVNVVDVVGQKSKVASATTKAVPVAVTGVKASMYEVKQVSLSWKLNPEGDIEKYVIMRGDNAEEVDNKIESVSGAASSYVDTGLKDGRNYYYKIRAVDKDKLEGKFSKVVGSTTKAVPVKPTGLEADLQGGGILITWQANPEPDIAKYHILLKGFFGYGKVGETESTSYIYSGELKPGSSLTFKVMAIDETGLKSEESDLVEVAIAK
ncbi:hypothetical protein MNBD_NITROSPINAE02-955 [hydrothermal vent metagenome]|uniref:Fibronectin type-III domain-containing protein n=1 Tax=hydrothermal vent metagenome TaxID=652676 RepID=A0A3B1BQI9_9ZZZZ